MTGPDMGAALPERAVRAVRWSREPEKQAWMEAHDRGQEAALLSMEFEGAFGFPLAGPQVSLWRSTNGRQARRSHGGGKPPSPVGSERDTGRGYVLVKVAEHPRVPQSKDNWRMKHVLAYERAHGPVPEGCVVVFADRDHSNFSPGNLVAVPRSLLGLLNGPGAPEWRDAETLSAAVAAVSLDRAIVAAEAAAPRRCGVCGRLFVPPAREDNASCCRRARTCPDCLAQGRKSKGTKTVKFTARCAVCGREFEAERAGQRRCRECISRLPKWGAEAQAASEGRLR